MDLLNRQIQEIPGVKSTDTFMSLEESIKRELPVD
jgi:hypothetical protein